MILSKLLLSDFSAISKKLGELWSKVPSNERYNWSNRAKRETERCLLAQPKSLTFEEKSMKFLYNYFIILSWNMSIEAKIRRERDFEGDESTAGILHVFNCVLAQDRFKFTCFKLKFLENIKIYTRNASFLKKDEIGIKWTRIRSNKKFSVFFQNV